MIWLSIITPVLNAATNFKHTLASLESQDAPGVQWIVVDSSTDVNEIPPLLNTVQGIDITYAWTTARGIFAAMNAGLAHARGTYTYFLNAGDTLAAPNTLSLIQARLRSAGEPAWTFGNVEMLTDTATPFIPPPWDFKTEQARLFARGHFPCHQGTFVKTDVMRILGGFNEQYEVAGDYELFLRLSAHHPVTRLDFTIARFAPGGTSSTSWFRGLREFHDARIHVFSPRGVVAIREGIDTAIVATRTFFYRGLWAPGRPLHRLVRRSRTRPSGLDIVSG